MKTKLNIMFAAALLLSLPVLAKAGTVVYQETFDNSSGTDWNINAFNTNSSASWVVYGGSSTATDLKFYGHVVAVKSAAGTDDGSLGYVWFSMDKKADESTNIRWSFATITTGLNIAAEGATLSWDLGSSAQIPRSQLLLQIDGQWYISNELFQPTNNSQTWGTNSAKYHNEVVFDTAASSWSTFTITPGGSLSIGAQLSADLSSSATITGIGVYAYNTSTTAGAVVTLDTITITSSIPEPSQASFIVGLGALLYVGGRVSRRRHDR